MSRQPGQDYPDVLLERYLAGDLGAELHAEIERACERSTILRQRLEELSSSRATFLAQDPPEQFAHRLGAQLQFEAEARGVGRRRGRWRAWLLAPSAAAAAATVLVTVVVMRSGTAPQSVTVASDASVPSVAATPPMAESAEEPSPVGAVARERKADKLANSSADAPVVVREPARLTDPARTMPAKPPPRAKKPKPKKVGKRRKGGGGRSGSDPLDALFDEAPAVTPTPSRSTKSAAPSVMGAPTERGKLAKSDIMAGVKNGLSSVIPCLKRAREAGELPAGRHTLVLSWTIRPDGKVAAPSVVGPASVLETSIPACFVRGMRKWTFARSPEGAPVRNFPFGPVHLK